VAIGSMVLQPGDETELTMTFTMHAGMEGPHDFRVNLPTNDTSWGDRTLVVTSNWIR
jgi:hypothetical protein